MAKPRVLISSFMLEPGDETDRYLQNSGIEVVWNKWHGGRDEEEMKKILQGISGMIASIDPFTNQVFDAAKDLKVVSRTGVGYDAIDVPAATAHRVAVCITPGTNNIAVAEFAFAFMIGKARNLIENHNEVMRGGWKRHVGPDLYGATLGIVGLGSIGKELAKRASAFSMKILAHDIYRDEAFAQKYGVTYVSLEELLRQSDYISLHSLLDASTRNMINAERLALMKPNAVLINTSRGGVIDQEALYNALKEKKIAGAALDVFEPEPLVADSPLRSLDNVYLAPHVAGQTFGSARAMGLMAAENVVAILNGTKPPFAVNAKELGL